MSDIIKALLGAGVDSDLIDERSDGLVRVLAAEGYCMIMGYDDGDLDTDPSGTDWWTATRYDEDGGEEMTDSWLTPGEMAVEVAKFAKDHES